VTRDAEAVDPASHAATSHGPRALVRVLFAAARPAQLALILGVYVLGAKAAAALGTAVTAAGSLAAGVVPLLFVAASVHYANEYADYETDALTERTPFSGGSGALVETGVDRQVALWAGAGTLAAGGLAAAGLSLGGLLSPTATALLALIAGFGWQYSVEPLALSRRGLGELDNAALGGVVLPAYGAATVGGPVGAVALASVPFALVVLLNLFATQWPDREADAAAGKRTLAVRWSAARLRLAYLAVFAAAGLSVLLLWPAVLPGRVAAVSLLPVPLLVWGWWGYTRRRVPWPTVSGMVLLALAQLAAWCL
jgi:1,4-dihydroxy-2-naphthoate octaprenyltransferase